MWNNVLWRQFGAAIDMLEAAIRACPDELWDNAAQQPAGVSMQAVGFWYIVYHTLFWLDFYLAGGREGFAPPAPFTLAELDSGALPERAYSKRELQAYLDYGRERCRTTIAELTDDRAGQLCEFVWGRVPFAELLIYNLRHVQHHTGQLNLILRQQIDSAPRWIAATPLPLDAT
jgi:uncharacterized damage-inducible protein DinB